MLDVLAARRILRPGDGGRYEIYHDVLAAPIVSWRARYARPQALVAAHRRNRRLAAVATAALAGLVVDGPRRRLRARAAEQRARGRARRARARARCDRRGAAPDRPRAGSAARAGLGRAVADADGGGRASPRLDGVASEERRLRREAAARRRRRRGRDGHGGRGRERADGAARIAENGDDGRTGSSARRSTGPGTCC